MRALILKPSHRTVESISAACNSHCGAHTCLQCDQASHPSLTCRAAAQLTRQWRYFLREHGHLWGPEYQDAMAVLERKREEAKVEIIYAQQV